MADTLRQRVQQRAELEDQTPRGIARRRQLEAMIEPTNALLEYNRQAQKPYIVPGEFSSSGWVVPSTGKEYVTFPQTPEELADTVAHEGLHQRREAVGASLEKRQGFGDQYVRDQIGHPDSMNLTKLREMLRAQKTYPLPENYNQNAEETYATYAGIEGRLPKGTAITSIPEFSGLNENQRLKDLMFSETSVPYGGVWEGQTNSPLGGIFEGKSGPNMQMSINSLLRMISDYRQRAAQGVYGAVTHPINALAEFLK